MNKNCGAVLALVVASSCGNSNNREDVKFLKRKNEELKRENREKNKMLLEFGNLDDVRGGVGVLKRENEVFEELNRENRVSNKTLLKFENLDDIRGDVEVLKKENEELNRENSEKKMPLEMKKNLSVRSLVSGTRSGFVDDSEDFSSYSFTLKKISGVWKLCWDQGTVNFDLYNRNVGSFFCKVLKSGNTIQGCGDYLKDRTAFEFFYLLWLLSSESLLGEENIFQNNEFEEILVNDSCVFSFLDVDSFMELFRICKSVKFNDNGSEENFRVDHVVRSITVMGNCKYGIYSNGCAPFFILGENSEDARAKFEKFCEERGFPSIVDE